MKFSGGRWEVGRVFDRISNFKNSYMDLRMKQERSHQLKEGFIFPHFCKVYRFWSKNINSHLPFDVVLLQNSDFAQRDRISCLNLTKHEHNFKSTGRKREIHKCKLGNVSFVLVLDSNL